MSIRSAGVALVVVAMSVHGAAAAPSGTAVAVVQAANIDGATGKQVLQPEAPVFSGDRIDTDAGGQAQIIFRDKTKLVVGPNSSMVIDAFVFNGNDTAQQISINAVKGAFRFMTGVSRKDAYSIITPTATIGVRGTEFDISIEKEGTTRVANFEGMTRICNRTNGVVNTADCAEQKDPCSLSVIRPTEPGVVQYSNKDVEFRNRQLKYYFNYIRDQSGLLKDFQVDLKQCKFASVVPEYTNPPQIGPVPPGSVPVPPPLPAPQPFTPTDPPAPPAPAIAPHTPPAEPPPVGRYDHTAD